MNDVTFLPFMSEIAAIRLLAGSIGIADTMFMLFMKLFAVTQRLVVIAFWIWRTKSNWSTRKKVVITIPFVIGLIAVTFIGLFILVLSSEADQGWMLKK